MQKSTVVRQGNPIFSGDNTLTRTVQNADSKATKN